MPAPPARMRSASVPCGLNSSCSSPARYWRSNSLFSPTYEEIILAICRVFSSLPRPNWSTPALFDTTVSPCTPDSHNATIRFSGMPHRPKPPHITLIPSRTTSASAACALGKTLLVVIGAGLYLPGRRLCRVGVRVRVVAEVRRQPALSLLHRDLLARGVVLHLVQVDLA